MCSVFNKAWEDIALLSVKSFCGALTQMMRDLFIMAVLGWSSSLSNAFNLHLTPYSQLTFNLGKSHLRWNAYDYNNTIIRVIEIVSQN